MGKLTLLLVLGFCAAEVGATESSDTAERPAVLSEHRNAQQYPPGPVPPADQLAPTAIRAKVVSANIREMATQVRVVGSNLDRLQGPPTPAPKSNETPRFKKVADKPLPEPVFADNQFQSKVLARNFDSISTITNINNTGGFLFIPADPHGASGPNHTVAVANVTIQFHQKDGTVDFSDDLQAFFAALAPANFTFDPKVLYDQIEERWVVVTLERTDIGNGDPANISRILVAVSDDDDPNGAWTMTAINSLFTLSGAEHWTDYPGFAVDEQAIYITGNLFQFFGGTITSAGAFGGARVWIIDKGVVGGFYSGGTASVSVHNPYAASGFPFPGTHQPAHIYGTPPAGNIGTYMVLNGLAFGNGDDAAQVFRIDDPVGTPVFTAFAPNLGDNHQGGALPAVPQSGGPNTVDGGDVRSLDAVWRDESLYFVNTLNTNVGDPDTGQNTAAFVEIDTTGGTVAATATQVGLIRGEDIGAGTHTFYPSIAVSDLGAIMISYSASSSAIFPSSYYTMQFPGDAAGTTRGSELIRAGLASYERTFGGPRNRWGDYTGLALDPNGSCFWAYNKHAITQGNPTPETGRWGSAFGEVCTLDFGDSPSTFDDTDGDGDVDGDDNPAAHFVSTDIYLGTQPATADAGQQVSATASSDTDESVSSFGVYLAAGGMTCNGDLGTYTTTASQYCASVVVNNDSGNPAQLVGWIDLNGNGEFDANERSLPDLGGSGTGVLVANTSGAAADATFTTGNILSSATADRTVVLVWASLPGPGTLAMGTVPTFNRIRITTEDGSTPGAENFFSDASPSPFGPARDGETEDFQVPAGTLPVTLSYFSAQRQGNDVQFDWQTVSETQNIGFYLMGQTRDGEWEHVGKLVASQAVDSLKPLDYSVRLPVGNQYLTFALAEVDYRGQQLQYGPFVLNRPSGSRITATPIDWAGLQQQVEQFDAAERQLLGPVMSTEAELRVRESGVYRVTYEQLLAEGIDLTGVETADLALVGSVDGPTRLYAVASEEADPLAADLLLKSGFEIAPPAAVSGPFGAGGYLEFVGHGVADDLYTDTQIYRLSVDPARALRYIDSSVNTRSGLQTDYTALSEVNRNVAYTFASPSSDPWYEQRLFADDIAVSADFSLSATEVLGGVDALLSIDLWGATDFEGDDLDHHVQILFNGSLLADRHFDGLEMLSLSLPVSAALLNEGDNQLRVIVPGDTGFDFDLIYVDRYSLRYQRSLIAMDDVLNAEIGTAATLDGFNDPQIVVYNEAIRESDFPRSTSLGYAVDTNLTGTVWAASDQSVRRPEISTAYEAGTDLLSGQADLVMISHPMLLPELDDLASLRQSQGLTVKLVDIRDIYANFSGGAPSGESIQQYLAQAHSVLGTQYALLVGADTYDYLDNLGLGAQSLVPTIYRATDSIIQFAPVDSALGDANLDGLPEIAVGRLPARSPEQLQVMIDKLMSYEQSAPDGVLLVADDDPQQIYTRINDQLEAMNGVRPTTRIDTDLLAPGGASSQLLTALNSGNNGLVNYVGHSSPTSWTFDGLFQNADVAQLDQNIDPYLVVQWGCWNVYHVAPDFDALGVSWLNGQAGGAAVLGASTLTSLDIDRLMGEAIYQGIVDPVSPRLGDVIQAARQRLFNNNPDALDGLWGWNLLGDPSQMIQ